MRLQKHSELEGRHAVLSPSNYHWTNYSPDKMARVYTAHMAAAKGDRLHDLAASLIRERVRLEDQELTLNMYVNDAIGFHMTPEQPLYYSDFAFGTADALAYRNGVLRVHDLKTGVHPTSVRQLECYCALFCLEYQFRPHELEIEMRIYQNNQIQAFEADPDTVFMVMDRYVEYTKLLTDLREEARR